MYIEPEEEPTVWNSLIVQDPKECWVDEDLVAEYEYKVQKEMDSAWVKEEISHGACKEEIEMSLWRDFEEWVQSHREMDEFYRGEDAYDDFIGR